MAISDSAHSPSGSEGPEAPGTDPSGENARSASARIVVLGGGEGGSAVLEELAETDLIADVVLVEPSTHHYDQPAWVRVGTEGAAKEDTRSSEALQVPPAVTWIRERVASIDPREQTVRTNGDTEIQYDYLVVALGTDVHWDRIRGLNQSLGTRGVCSVYGYEQAEQAWEMIRSFEGGRAVFTAPSTPHKGGRAPLGILRRAEALWRETGVRDRTDLFYTTAATTEEVDEALTSDAEPPVHVYTGYDLVDVRPDRREAVFRVTKGQSRSQHVLEYDLLHVVPPMRPPALLEEGGLAHRDGPMRGYLDVDPESLRHRRFDTVFGVGDAVGVEGEKTGERAREQAARVARRLRQIASGE